ncbi:MAG: hypothetical protein KJO79_03145 [Verrucomicrobiae bacterium]|nr:hypothetical protein [Verrucomicrobiae bacterium]NNJ86151.1 hypothetical protein [Akkermansiaceae bacterium]
MAICGMQDGGQTWGGGVIAQSMSFRSYTIFGAHRVTRSDGRGKNRPGLFRLLNGKAGADFVMPELLLQPD